jgi:signal transduction histidine kinase
MKTVFLEFEQPVAELEGRIDELRYAQDDSAVDISEEIQRLTLPALTTWDGVENETRCHIDQQCVTKSGETVWVNVNAKLIRDSRGRVLFNLALIEDTTLRKRADETIRALNDSLELRVERRTEELAHTNRQLATANKELEAFAYSVSHDLRAPLRSMDCFSQIIIEEYADRLDEEGVKYLERIRAGAKTMGQLIDDLLNLARLSGVQPEAVRRPRMRASCLFHRRP